MSKEKTPSAPAKRNPKKDSSLGETSNRQPAESCARLPAKNNPRPSLSLTPESMYMVLRIMSDCTLTCLLRMIEGFSVQSFRLNDAVISTFVNFHRRPKLGLQSTIWYETVKLCGAD